MSTALREQIVTALAAFASSSRLYALKLGDRDRDRDRDGEGDDDGTLLVEAFAADDAVGAIGTRDVIVLSTSAHLDAGTWLGQPAALDISLADGTRSRFAGDSRSWPPARRRWCASGAICLCWNPSTRRARMPSQPASRPSAMPTCAWKHRKRAASCGMDARPSVRCAPARA